MRFICKNCAIETLFQRENAASGWIGSCFITDATKERVLGNGEI